MKCLNPNTGETVINGAVHPYRYPCGKCDHCRRVKQQHWKLRLMLESVEHDDMSFVTFTYNDLNVKEEVSKDDAQKLIKRLRKLWYEKSGKHIRYYIVAEYGSRSGRSHYHAIIYGISPYEQQVFENAWRKNVGTPRKPEYVSLGFVQARDITAARIGYVIKYSTKLLESPRGNTENRTPEFALMSRGSKKRKTRGIGLNGISRIVDSIRNAKRSSNEERSLSEYFDTYVGSMRVGSSRMSVDPYLRKQIYDSIREIEQQELVDKINFYKEIGIDTNQAWNELMAEERKHDLRRARRRTRRIPLTIDAKLTEMGEAKDAQKVAQRKQRGTKKQIKL